MASSKKQPKNSIATNNTLLNHVKLFLRDFFLQQKCINPSLVIAYSGGLDSTVLLHVLCQLQAYLPMQLSAVHINHQISKNAGHWVNVCSQTCANLNIPIKIEHVDIDKKSGLGIEAAARQARYHALSLQKADYICLGQHQDDQAETLLLQLARGAGAKGLSGMGQFDIERRLLRPFLNVSRAELMTYAKAYRLQWVEDESNTDTKFDRNFIRHELVPIFTKQYPTISQTLARTAMHMAKANEMLNDLAAIDAQVAIDQSQPYGAVKLAVFAQLSRARQGNLVRWWLDSNQIDMPSAAVLNQILAQLMSERTDAAIKIKVAKNLYIMRYNSQAFLVNEPKKLTTIDLLWHGENAITLPDASRLLFIRTKGEGIAYHSDSDFKLRIKNREGGERLRLEIGGPRRRLKTILQSAEMPPWQREQLPLIYIGDTLATIPNVGIEASLKANREEMGITIKWVPA